MSDEDFSRLELCKHGCDHDRYEEHSCPYQSEINNDPNPEFCSCCEECEQDCAENI